MYANPRMKTLADADGALDNGQRSPRKMLRKVVARQLGRKP
jgi:hypothetical protein